MSGRSRGRCRRQREGRWRGRADGRLRHDGRRWDDGRLTALRANTRGRARRFIASPTFVPLTLAVLAARARVAGHAWRPSARLIGLT
jgi:hypothetical protein